MAWAPAAEFIEKVEHRRTRRLGLVGVLGVEPGEPVYFQPPLFDPEKRSLEGGRSPRWYLPFEPLPPFREPDKEPAAIRARLDALPHVTAEEIAAAGFAPAPEEWRRGGSSGM